MTEARKEAADANAERLIKRLSTWANDPVGHAVSFRPQYSAARQDARPAAPQSDQETK